MCKGRGVYMIELMDEEPPVDGFMEDASDDEFDATISLNALTGISDADMMQLTTTIAGVTSRKIHPVKSHAKYNFRSLSSLSSKIFYPEP